MNNFITTDLLAVLNILILERINFGCFKITGTIPDWVSRFCHHKLKSGMEILIPQENFPFLENFLIDAEEFWQIDTERPIKSGLWQENDQLGNPYYFEASAIKVDQRKLLLIEWLKETYEEKQKFLQLARENELIYQKVRKENQNKEILVHCIIHDIAGQLSSINCCLALLEFENLTPKGKERLEIARKQYIKQEMLIREILVAFSTEVESLESFAIDIDKAPNILITVQEIIELLSPSFVFNNVQLRLASDIDVTADWKVIGDKSHLERIISNLLENALRHSPLESTTTINLKQDDDYILFTVDDQGSGVPHELEKTLFKKFVQGQAKSGRAGLGLYFCRITVERWGGSIGYSRLTEGGSRFWFRLLKPTQGGETPPENHY